MRNKYIDVPTWVALCVGLGIVVILGFVLGLVILVVSAFWKVALAILSGAVVFILVVAGFIGYDYFSTKNTSSVPARSIVVQLPRQRQ